MKIKFCGIRRLEDIALMNEFNPDYVGFIFAESKRQISADTALMLTKKLDANIKTVGVFVDEAVENIAGVANTAGLRVIQLHGNEDEGYIKGLKSILPEVEIWKAVRVSCVQDILDASKLSADMLLLDSFCESANGGTGKAADLNAVKASGLKNNFFLAGGLNSENISAIAAEIKPYGVDISSGIEENGFKSRDKILEIMRCLNV